MDDTPTRYRVFFPGVCRDQLREIALEAQRLDIHDEINASLREVEYRLQCEANDWGESRGYLPVMKMDLRVGFARVLTVWYAVNLDRRVVYVQAFRLHGGLADDS